MTIINKSQARESVGQPTSVSAADELGPNCEVGTKLRALYASIQDEAIPDKFLDLLEQLDAAEKMHGDKHDNIGSS